MCSNASLIWAIPQQRVFSQITLDCVKLAVHLKEGFVHSSSSRPSQQGMHDVGIA